MMLANAETVEADLFGKDSLVDNVAQHLGLRQLGPRRINRHVAERIDAKFEGLHGIGHYLTLRPDPGILL